VDVKDAEIAVLANDLKQMEVKAPVTGVIRDVLKHEGEWVKQGEGIVVLTRMDKLLVEGFLDSKTISPNDATGLPAKVKFTLANKKTAEFDGLVIDQTAPKLELDGKFPVWVIIENRQAPDKAGNERWVIRPGMTGVMTLELD
jgi:pyruvate/2-oxoglutarate dehydrogenase complex dihydrolipoamide acyltransferase (E2) component